MNLKDPATLAAAWLLVPLLVVLVSAALGRGLAALAGLRLGLLTAPAGFLAGIVVMTVALRVGLSGVATVVVTLLLAVPGAVLAVREALGARERAGATLRAAAWPGGAGLGVYGLAMAPVVGSGRSVVPGYMLNNDPAVHISLVEWLRDHGASAPASPGSSFESVATLITDGYPLGGHVWLLFGGVTSGVEAFHLWAPMLALTAAMLALAAVAIVRGLGLRGPLAAAGGALVACGFLPYSFVVQGGFKEVLLAGSLLAAAALFAAAVSAGATVRRLVPPVVAAGAGVAAFSVAAVAWFAPAALAAAAVLSLRADRPVLRRPGRRATLVAAVAGVLLLGAAVPLLATATTFVRENRDIFSAANQVGNLLAPVPFWETFNVWFARDYRYTDPLEAGLTIVGVALAAVLAAVGAVAILRRRPPAALVAVTGGVVGSVAILVVSQSVYFEAKALVILAPAFGIATIAGLLWLWRRSPRLHGLSAFLGAALAIAVLTCAAMVYAGAWVSPGPRFEALADAAERVPGDGPVLVNEREFYAKYVLRDERPWNSWDHWQPYRQFIWGEVPRPLPRTPDLDDYRTSLMSRFAAILERKRPGGSTPPGNYAPVYENAYYRLWQRTGPAPRMHLSLGVDRLGGAGELDCARDSVRRLMRAAGAGGTLRVARAAPPIITADAEDWGGEGAEVELGPAERFLRRRGGIAGAIARLEEGRTYRVWIQGSYGPGVRVSDGKRVIGEARGDVGEIDQWHDLGEVTPRRDRPTLTVQGLDRPWWLAGSHFNDLTGPLAFEPADAGPRVEEVPAARARSLCGERLDWIELP